MTPAEELAEAQALLNGLKQKYAAGQGATGNGGESGSATTATGDPEAVPPPGASRATSEPDPSLIEQRAQELLAEQSKARRAAERLVSLSHDAGAVSALLSVSGKAITFAADGEPLLEGEPLSKDNLAKHGVPLQLLKSSSAAGSGSRGVGDHPMPLPGQDEAALIQRAREGDSESYRKLQVRHGSKGALRRMKEGPK